MFQTFKLPATNSGPANGRTRLALSPSSSSAASTTTTTRVATSSSSASKAPAQRAGNATPRQTAARACDRCRLYRVRCSAWPCEQCRRAKAKCVMSGDGPTRKRAASDKHRTVMPAAPAVRLPNTRSDNDPSASYEADHTSAITLDALPESDRPDRPTPQASPSQTTDDSGLDEYYQLDCPTLFFSKINSFFGDSHAQPYQGQTDGASPGRFVTIPCPAAASTSDFAANTPQLTYTESSSFIRLFWQAHHCMMPFLDPDEVEKLHCNADPTEPQWSSHNTASPLIDILTALGMQHARTSDTSPRIISSSLRHAQEATDQSNYSCWPGYAYFRRCADFVTFEVNPTSSTVLCQTLMATYLIRGNHLQSAYRTLGVAIRDALHLNLDKEPPLHLVPEHRQRLKHLWWKLATLDAQCSCQLNRPPTIAPSAIQVSLPCQGAASDYSIYSAQLAMAVSNIRDKAPCSESLGLSNKAEDVSALEHNAEALSRAVEALETWLVNLPPAWRSNVPTERDLLSAPTGEVYQSLGLSIPTAIQRQKVLLQLHYHDAHNLLRRSFIYFPRALNLTRLQQPHTDQHARMALIHSIALTHLVHRQLSSSDLLYGWPELLQPLWNAVVTMLAFVVANPVCTRAPAARGSIAMALEIFSASASTNSLSSYASRTLPLLSGRLQELVGAVEAGSMTKLTPGASTNSSLSGPSMANSTMQSPSTGTNNFDICPSPSSLGAIPATSQGLADLDSLFFADENLRSWMDSIQNSTWQTYQHGVNDFLSQPDDFTWATK